MTAGGAGGPAGTAGVAFAALALSFCFISRISCGGGHDGGGHDGGRHDGGGHDGSETCLSCLDLKIEDCFPFLPSANTWIDIDIK